MTTILLIIALLIAIAFGVKAKLMNYVMAMWMAEKEYPPPESEDVERLAKTVTDRWFKKF